MTEANSHEQRNDGRDEQLDEARVHDRLAQVTERTAAWILLQEPDFIGFGVVEKGRIAWPPGVAPNWSRVSDLRLFGEKGEWHLWSRWDGSWKSRLLQKESLAGGIEAFPSAVEVIT